MLVSLNSSNVVIFRMTSKCKNERTSTDPPPLLTLILHSVVPYIVVGCLALYVKRNTVISENYLCFGYTSTYLYDC